ncbi:MAG: mreC [Ilumatobacteraceae bacterium]|nr:mreC [Ilumatobacteraceae bacterium]
MAIYSMGRRRVIVLLILTSILLITLDQRGNALIDRSRSAFSLVLEPFDAASRTISRPVINAWHGVVNYDDLQRQNEALQAQVDNQRGAEVQARAAILEYQELLTLNQLLGTSSYPSAPAQVVGFRANNFQYTVEIDKGSKQGIAVGMPVVNGGGLVGSISQVFPQRSIVLLIIDPEFGIGAKVLTESEPSRAATLPNRPTEADVNTTTTETTLAPEDTTPPANPDVDPLAPVEEPTTTHPPVAEPGTETTTVEIIRETGLLQGQGADRPLILRFVDASATAGRVAVGSTVQTAGGAKSTAPPGIPIGVISSVTTQSGSSSLVVEVDQSAGDLSKLNFLRVLLYVPNLSGS